MNLYTIDSAITALVDPETGEIQNYEAFEELQMARDQKIENMALVLKNAAAASAAIKAEMDALKSRKEVADKTVERMKEYITQATGGQKFETAKVRLTFRSSTRVEISDEGTLLDWLERHNKENCIKYKTPEISRSEVGKLLKDGEEVPGAILAEYSNLQVK